MKILKKYKEKKKYLKYLKEAKNKFYQEEKEREVCDECFNCMFLDEIKCISGSICFKCKIDPYTRVDMKNYECEYRKDKK